MNCFHKQVTFQINGIGKLKLKLKFYSKKNNASTLIIFGFINNIYFPLVHNYSAREQAECLKYTYLYSPDSIYVFSLLNV